MIKSRILKLKKKIKKYDLDYYLVPKNDHYFNEYPLQDRLKYISNFDGSAGLAVISKKNDDYLFVDGRYTTQANLQSGKNFKIKEISEKLPFHILKEGIKVGFNPYHFTNSRLHQLFKDKYNLIPIKEDILNVKKKIKKISKFYLLDSSITGETSLSKIKKIVKFIKSKNSEYLFITSSENVAWLLNIRGHDNPYNPTPNCKLIISNSGKINIFTNKKKISKTLESKLKFQNIYEEQNLENFICNLNFKRIIVDTNSCSFAYTSLILKNGKIANINDPIYLMKSIKSNSEIKNTIDVHIKDGVAMTKFLYWVKKNNKNLTEIGAEKKLESFRRKNKKYLYPSFNTIAASGPNGAIIHYKASRITNRTLNKQDLFLCDSGGQYKYGTTDITRTICFSTQSKRIKNLYTKVLKGHIAVATTQIEKGINGTIIDKKARKFLNQNNLDYAHGTGHGVGFFLNVHEGPVAISKFNKVKILPGMIMSNEPGYYKKNCFGIRIENLLYVKKNNNNLIFQNLTMVPLEKDLINFDLLNKSEKNYLMSYNIEVYSKIRKYLKPDERRWVLSQI